jgi:LacI family transcriptional regulator
VATIADVAREADVSIATVSKALNGTGQLRVETRERVLAASRRLGYVASAQARSLVRGRTFTVGLLTSDTLGRFSIPIIHGIEDTLGRGQTLVLFCDSRGDDIREQYYVDALLARRVDAIIVTGIRTDPRPPIRRTVPVPVVYAYARSADERFLSVLPDDETGGRMAAEHLYASGRRRIGHITGPASFAAVVDRERGLAAALEDAGVELPGDRILHGAWSEAWGREAMERLLAAGPSLDAVFCGSDQIARGVADALRERGRRVPDDVALVGYDNWAVMAVAARPPLTSVDPELEQLGRDAAQRLLAMVDGATDSGVVRRPGTLVIRESSEGTR